MRNNFDPLKESSTSLVDLKSPEFFANPYEIYKKLRKNTPVAPVKTGGFLITRHEDISAILLDKRYGNAPSRFSVLRPQKRTDYSAADLACNIIPFLDKPDHTKPRRILAKAFHPAFKEFSAELRMIAKDYARTCKTKGKCEIIHEICAPYSLDVMSRFLGIPLQDRDFIKPLSESFFYLFAPLSDPLKFENLNKEIDTFRHYFLNQVQLKKKQPDDGMITRLLKTPYEGETLSDQEIADHCILLFADGVENIQYAIGNMLALLEYHLKDLRILKEEANLKKAMAEALRINPPAQIIPRIVKEKATLHDAVFKPNTPVFLALGSANHDETVFEKPEYFNPDRELNKVLTFGAGAHSCIGGMFGTAQISFMLQELITQGIRPETKLAELTYHHRFGHRWPEKVMVRDHG